jgi:hypothetical protein
MQKRFLLAPVLAGIVSMSGCAVESGEPSGEAADATSQSQDVAFLDSATGEEVHPFESLSFEGGSKVGFFESAPGELMVFAWGSNESPHPITEELAAKKLSASGLYETLSGKRAPASLLEAEGRAEVAAKNAEKSRPLSVGAAPVEDIGGESVRSKESATYLYDCQGSFSYDEWFNCNFCYHPASSSGYDHTWMWSTGDGSYSSSDKIHHTSTVSVYGGNSVVFKVETRTWYSWATKTDVRIPNGKYVSSYKTDTGLDFDVRAKVTQGSGASYHWCGYGY